MASAPRLRLRCVPLFLLPFELLYTQPPPLLPIPRLILSLIISLFLVLAPVLPCTHAQSRCLRATLPPLAFAENFHTAGETELAVELAESCFKGVATGSADSQTVPEFSECDYTPLCSSGALLAAKYLCLQGEWRWSGAGSGFCPQWRHCSWLPTTAVLECDGRALNSTQYASRGNGGQNSSSTHATSTPPTIITGPPSLSTATANASEASASYSSSTPAPPLSPSMSLPWLWDGTLRRISIVNDFRLGRLQTGAIDLAGNTLTELDLSGNAISQVGEFSLSGSSMLTSLNISYNAIETFPSFALYPSRRLRLFDARNNAPTFRVSYAGLGPATRYCGDDAPPLVLVDDPRLCVTQKKEVEGMSPCYYVICDKHLYGYATVCKDGAAAVVPYYYMCDGVDDGCHDELLCQSFPAIRSGANFQEQHPLCQDIADCFPGQAFLHFDAADVVYLTAPPRDGPDPFCPMKADFSTRLFFTRSLDGSPWRQEIADGPRRLTMGTHLVTDAVRQAVDVVIDTLYQPGTSEPDVTCTITYHMSTALYRALQGDDGLTSETSPETTVASEPGGSARRSSNGPLIFAVAGCLAALVLCVSLGLALFLRRKRGAHLHRLRLDNLAPCTPQHILEGAQEQFLMQYAGVFGDHAQQQQSWQDAYNHRLVSVTDIELTDSCLGEGFSGKVYLAYLQGAWQQKQRAHDGDGRGTVDESGTGLPGLRVALKIITRAASGQNDGDAVVRCALLEARLHARLDHPNLVRLLAVQEARQPIMLALELCEHGALLDVLRAASKGDADFSVPRRMDMAAQAAAGLRYLHGKLCIHRDVAARNVLLAGVPPSMIRPACGYVLKLSDLGLARQLRTEADYYKTTGLDDAVPIRWQCPEAVLTRVYTAKSDVYSFGVLLYEIFSQGATPYGNLTSSEVLRMVKAGELLARPSHDTPQDVFALMRACTVLNVSRRPSMTTIQAKLSGVWTLERDAAMDDRGLKHQETPDGDGEAEHEISQETAL